jgi:hypothetical protein
MVVVKDLKCYHKFKATTGQSQASVSEQHNSFPFLKPILLLSAILSTALHPLSAICAHVHAYESMCMHMMLSILKSKLDD